MYVKLFIKKGNLTELDEHLSYNNYDYGLDVQRRTLFVLEDELSYMKTILEDHGYIYIQCVC